MCYNTKQDEDVAEEAFILVLFFWERTEEPMENYVITIARG